MARSDLEAALGTGSPAQLRRLLAAELARSAKDLAAPRSGREEPVTVALTAGLLAVAPVAAAFRADPQVAPPRAQRLVEALMEALGEPQAGDHDGFLALAFAPEDPELAGLLFDEAAERIDRLRTRAVVIPAGVLDVTDLRPLPTARAEPDVPIAHDDPNPARRAARRILQRLNGMGKWGGYHTEFAHVARGFEGNERALAMEVGEALLDAGLLTTKPSVGQRHVSLNSRRAGEIHRLIADGEVPTGLRLPS